MRSLVAKAVELNAQSLCRLANAVGHLQGCCHKLVAGCPAIGCGIRGFPAPLVAKAGLQHLVPEGVCQAAQAVPYVEVRFWDTNVLNAWTSEAFQRNLEECEESQVMKELWQGDTLEVWTQKRLQARTPKTAMTLLKH
eukprot:symbB.v1.2.015046.t1/scaffold1112.1/size147309/4